MKCNKVARRIECEACGYPYSEAMYPDNYDDPLPCDAAEYVLSTHIKDLELLKTTAHTHPWDCKCLIHR